MYVHVPICTNFWSNCCWFFFQLFFHCKSNHEIFPLFFPIMTVVGNFPLSLAGEKFPTTLLQWEISHCIDGNGKFSTVSITVGNFPTEVHFVGKSPVWSHSGWTVKIFPTICATVGKWLFPTSLFPTSICSRKTVGNCHFSLNISYFLLNLQ